MIIDAHTHIGVSKDRLWSIEQLSDSMKESGIDYSLVIANRANGGSDYSSTENIIKLTKKLPQIKIIGDISLSQIEEESYSEIFNYLKMGNIQGVKLYPGYSNFYPADIRLNSLYAFCEKNNHPVVIHTGLLEMGCRGILKQTHPLNVDDVAYNFPDLKIVIAHMGNPWLMDCGAVLCKNKNVYADISGYFTEDKTISKDEIEFFIKEMTNLKNFIGGFEKILFGTDYPLYNQKEYLQAVRLFPLTGREKKLVFWKNANMIYNLGL